MRKGLLLSLLWCSLMSLTVRAELPLVLVSDNMTGDGWKILLNAATPKVKTGATYSWITQGDYKTDTETLSTDQSHRSRTDKQDSTGFAPLVDGRAGIFTADRTFSKWRSGQWATAVFDLQQPYAVAKVQLWALADASRYTESIEVLLSDDGIKYVSRGVYKNQSPRQAEAFVRLDAMLERPVQARYVKLRIKREPGASQQQLGEIAIWAVKPGQPITITQDDGEIITGALSASQPDPVRFSGEVVAPGSIRLDWSDFAAADRDVIAWKVYQSSSAITDIGAPDVNCLETVKGNQHHYVVFGLEPAAQYWFAVTAVYNGSGMEFPQVRPIKMTTRQVFACDTFGDMLAINHFPFGGGAHVSRPNEKEWQIVALDMLARTPFKEIRWWKQDPFWVKEFAKRGIGLLAWPRSEQDTRQANEMGVFAFSAGNEPDLSGKPMEEYLEKLKKRYKMIKEVNPKNVMTAPTSGCDEPSLEWLDRFLAAGGKDCLDVLDLHTYSKASSGHEVPDGVPLGAPEALFSDMAKVRAILAKHGMDDVPIISTEYGWTTTPHGSPVPNTSPELQADYLVRGLVLSHVLGLKRVYWYSFFDEGEDFFYSEHKFGLVDYNLQAKPGYYASIVLGEQIGSGVLVGKVTGADTPRYGYTYQVDDTLVSVLWDAAGSSAARIACEDDQVEVVQLLGERRNVLPRDGRFRLRIGPSAVYIRSKSPITLLQASPIVTPPKPSVTLDYDNTVFYLQPEEQNAVNTTITNGLESGISGAVQLCDAQGNMLQETAFDLEQQLSKSFALTIPAQPIGPALQYYIIRTIYESDIDSYAHQQGVWVRTLATLDKQNKLYQGTMSTHHLDSEIYVVANEELEVACIPSMGGRIIEIIDRRNHTNQVSIDYDLLPKLTSFSFKWAIWDRVNRSFKNSVFQPVFDDDQDAAVLRLNAEDAGLQFTKELRLEPGQNELVYNLHIKNISARSIEVTYYGHPEYVVGGTAEHNTDVVLMPGVDELIRIPVWLGLGDRSHAPLGQGWWAIHDLREATALAQFFSLDDFNDMRIWFDPASYNIEPQGKPFDLAPHAARSIYTRYVIWHDLPDNWQGPQ